MKRCKFAMIPVGVLVAIFVICFAAVRSEAASSGSYGDNTWTLDNKGLLTISGSHEMRDYDSTASRPWYDSEVKEVVINRGVTTVGNKAFANCNNLTSVVIADSVVRIGKNAFYNCTNLKSITIPDSVEIVDASAFEGCVNLTSVTVGNQVKRVADGAFARCSSLTNITLPDSVAFLGKRVFSNCSSLTTITIPDGIADIGSRMFDQCSNLKTVVLPASVTTIGDIAFRECDNLAHVFYRGTRDRWENITIAETAALTADVHCGVTIGSCLKDAVYCPECDCCYLQDGTAKEHGEIVFKNWDGKTIQRKVYHKGDTIKKPSAPTRPADNTYTYEFAGWDKEIVACAGDATYTATYTPTYIDYTVTFANEDGTELSQKTYHWGDEITVPAEPAKVADNTYTYRFAGWDKEIVACAGDATYTATYTPTYIDYTVTFANEDGTILFEKTYHWGDEVEVPDAPAKVGNETFTYAFAGWDKEVVAVAGDAAYTVTYTATYIDYTVKFVYDDGTVIQEVTYHYGDTVTAPINPQKAPTVDGVYTFTGWDKEISSVTGDVTYTAQFVFAQTMPEFNGDGQVTDADAIYLLRYTLFPDDYPLTANGDINNDGNITDGDAVYLLRYTLFPEEYPLYPKKKDE